jgi:hypothetical protein
MGMNELDEMIARCREVRDSILADIKRWRENGWKLHRNNVDATKEWLEEQQRRADSLDDLIRRHEGDDAE